MKIYVVHALEASKKCRIGTVPEETESKISLTWADGMIGIMPVFNDYDAAKVYAGDKFPVVEMTTMEDEIFEENLLTNKKYTATPKSCQTCYCKDRCFHKECVAPVFKN